MKSNSDIAIVGMSCVFPGAGDVQTFWNNIINKVDAIKSIPNNRIDPVFFDKNASDVDRFYCTRGGFIDDYTDFNPVKYGIVPNTIDGTEPDQLLTLDLSHKALVDAGIFEKEISLDKTGIILGRGNYLGRGLANVADIVRSGESIVRTLRKLLPELDENELTRIKKEFQKQKGKYNTDTTMGLIPNLVASIVANRLNLGGPAYTIDAACASSLIALDHAVTELNSKRCDMMIAGGVHLCHDVTFWSVFTQLGALSKTEMIKPFNKNADGLLIGEGCGLVVLKRLEDAIKDNHRIYAIIKGTGVASDGSGTSLMSPSVKGQAKAIRQAWSKAKINYNRIGYIETHGTGTLLGDKIEAETLLQVFGPHTIGFKAGLGSVKSMIGHTMPAAGIAGVIKTALALYHKKLPPTLHCDDPIEILEKSRFAPVTETMDWYPSQHPLVAGVNAFGFGGINAHVVLQSFEPENKLDFNTQLIISDIQESEKFLLLARETSEQLIEALENNETVVGEGNHRIAIVNPTSERLQRAIKIINLGVPWRNRNDFWYSNNPLITKGGKIAFVFPGLDGISEGGSIDSVADYFELSKQKYSDKLNTKEYGMKVFETNRLLDFALKQLGIIPAAIAGHSMGEWTGLVSSGMVEENSMLDLTSHIMQKDANESDKIFLAVGCGYDKIKLLIEDIDAIYLSNDNCPNQVVLCGRTDSVDRCKKILNEKDIFNQTLSFRSGFHSPFAAEYVGELVNHLEELNFQTCNIPLWSATTVAPYPEDIESIKKLQIDHILNPVRFRELTEKLFKEGFNVFIQIGAGGLTGFIDDTLRGKNYLAIPANVPKRPALEQLKRVLASLFVEGKEIDLSFLGITNFTDKKITLSGKDRESSESSNKKSKISNTNFKLNLGLSFENEFKPLANFINKQRSFKTTDDVSINSSNPLLNAFNENLNEIKSAQAEILQQFGNRLSGVIPEINSAKPTEFENKSFSKKLTISLADYPELKDHSLYIQKPGWENIEDLFPVVPLTMTIQLLGELTSSLKPEMKVCRFENFRVYQWIKVASPFSAIIEGNWMDSNHFRLKMENFADVDIKVTKEFNEAPVVHFIDLGPSLNVTLGKDGIYGKYMFHGPDYQGIESIEEMGEKGIRGIIKSSRGKGSLLDNAGQLFGLWLMFLLPTQNISFPVKVGSIEFFDDMMDQTGEFECTCKLTHLDESFVSCDMILKKNNRVWAEIKGWQNRRLEHDTRLWQLSFNRTETLMASVIAPGIYIFNDAYKRPNSWEALSYCYLNQPERIYYESLSITKKKIWLISRIALKDAVRELVFKTKGIKLFPNEFSVKTDSVGKPYLEGEFMKNIYVSLAHKNNYGVAIASENSETGIDIEEITERDASFIDMVLTPSEQRLIDKENSVEFITRCWVAKEVYGKYIGKGLQGNPKNYIITEINDDVLAIENTKIKTLKYLNFIIGWKQ